MPAVDLCLLWPAAQALPCLSADDRATRHPPPLGAPTHPALRRCTPLGLTLGQLLAQPDFVVPGVPLFFVVAKGTEYRQRFLAQGLS